MLDYEVKEFQRRVKLQPRGPCDSTTSSACCSPRPASTTRRSPLFQQARTSPTLKVQALHQMGQSFEANGSSKLAERNYKDALKFAEPDDLAPHQRPALPARPRRRDPGQQPDRRGALQRGRRQRLYVPRRRRSGSRILAILNPTAAFVVCSSFRFDAIGIFRPWRSDRAILGPVMPNTPSAIKRLKQSTKRRMHNRITKKVIKTYSKRTLAAAAAKEFEKAEADFRTAIRQDRQGRCRAGSSTPTPPPAARAG